MRCTRARFIEAEEKIAAILSRNMLINLSADELADIDWVLDHAAEVLNWSGFVPNEARRQAVLQAFKYRYSICRVLVSEESSMNSSSLMAALLTNTSARHIIFIGDKHQLQPLGPGSPFRDMIALWGDPDRSSNPELSNKLSGHSEAQ
jgi:hypothetical protein